MVKEKLQNVQNSICPKSIPSAGEDMTNRNSFIAAGNAKWYSQCQRQFGRFFEN